MYKFQKPYTLAGLEPTIFRTNGGDDATPHRQGLGSIFGDFFTNSSGHPGGEASR
jgi:hypothetical protein